MGDRVYLVDTSAWILSFKREEKGTRAQLLKDEIEKGNVATTKIIILELLTGAKNKEEFKKLKERLESLIVLEMTNTMWVKSYKNGFELKKRGITIPAIDIIIATLAKENNLILLHHDNHFELIKNVISINTLDYIL